MVQLELRSCRLFRDEEVSVFGSLCSNPTYAELLLVSFLRSLGVMDNDMKLRLRWARSKLHLLLARQRTKSPRTSVHFLRAVVHVSSGVQETQGC